MIKNLQLHLGELIKIETQTLGTFDVKVQFVREHEIWTQKFLEEGMDLEGKVAKVQIVRDSKIWTPKYLGDNSLGEEASNYKYYIDVCLYFEARIIKNDLLQGILMTKIDRISEIMRMQRRKTFRLHYMFDVQLRKKNDDTEYIRCHGMDISEAGIGVNTVAKNFNLGDAIECVFELENETYMLPATVVRKVDKMTEEGFMRLGLKFNIEKEKQIRFIRRFIYKKQIERNWLSKNY